MLRNPIATPFTLGISSGASLGASLVILLGMGQLGGWGVSAPFAAAMMGALISGVLLFGLLRCFKSSEGTRIILVGVLVNYLLSSLIVLVQYAADPLELMQMMRWLIGSVRAGTPTELIFLIGAAGVSLIGIWLHANALNALLLGRQQAAARGVSVASVERLLLGSISIGVAASVSLCGGIGFVGILEPHLSRELVGNDHRRLIPATFLMGGIVVVLADMIGRVVLSPLEIPAGIVTPIIEIPVALYLLSRSSQR
jgi:iron complex transport system permease protein